jgi:translation initiation factor IF-1
MSKKLMRTTSVVLLAAALPFFTACGSMETGGQAAEPGAIAVATAQITATVKAINHKNRTVTLAGPNGKRVTYKVSEAAVNFDQIRVGDRVKVKFTEAIAVYLRPQGTPPSVGEGAAVALAPKGAMPGGMVATTTEVTARVVSVDAATHHVTLQLPDGRKRTVSVNPSVDLSRVAPGDSVTAQVVNSLAISVEKP